MKLGFYSQNYDALRMLTRNHDGITAREALAEHGIMRLASRIGELRELGVKIESQPIKVPGKRPGQFARVARYRLVDTNINRERVINMLSQAYAEAVKNERG